MEWFKIGMPPALLMGLIATYMIIKMFPPDIKDISAGQDVMQKQLSDMGKMSAKEIYTFVIFIITLLLWATDKLHGLDTTLVALLAVAAMIAPVPTQVMPWKEAEKKVPWNVFIVYGAGLSMGSLLVKTGAAAWLASTFFHPLLNLDVKLQVVIFIWLMLALQVLFTGAGPKTRSINSTGSDSNHAAIRASRRHSSCSPCSP